MGGLTGSGLTTLAVGFVAHRVPHRRLLLAATLVMAATGLAFASVTQFWPLVVIAFVGTLNPSSGDVSVFLPLEHAVLSHVVADRERTGAFARYSLVGAFAGALGALFAAVPELTAPALGLEPRALYPWMFTLYAVLGFISGAIYRRLPATAL